MFYTEGVRRFEGCKGVRKLAQGAADTVVFGVVVGVLDCVAATYGGGVVVVIGFIWEVRLRVGRLWSVAYRL